MDIIPYSATKNREAINLCCLYYTKILDNQQCITTNTR